jgi:cysteine desulfurase
MRVAVENARGQVAAMVNAEPEEIVFTSGGTESCNLAIKGIAGGRARRGQHIITSTIEHPAVRQTCEHLKSRGFEITYVGVDRTGQVDPDEIQGNIRPDTILISIMHANNEVGTIQPIARISRIARERGVLFHTDAAQTCGKISTDVRALGVDLLTVAGHKLYAPQGIGALYIRNGVELEPLHHGAGHERRRRAGTEAVPAIVGLGAAADLAARWGDHPRIPALRDRLHEGLRRAFGERLLLFGHPNERLPNTLNVGVRGCVGEELLARCPDLCAATGAACHAGTHEPSSVLTAMGVAPDLALTAMRLSLGRMTTEADVDAAVEMIKDAAA